MRDGADRQRLAIERVAIRRIAQALEKQLRLAIPNAASVDGAVERLGLGEKEIEDAILEMITNAVLLGQDIGRTQINAIYGVEKQIEGIDWEALAGDAVT